MTDLDRIEEADPDTIDISHVFMDMDEMVMGSDELTLSVTADEGIEASLIDDTLVVSYGENTSGSVGVVISVTDLSGLTAVDTLNIQIENINDVPVLEEIGDRETDEDVPLVITLSAEDGDGDVLTFTAESDNENVDVSLFDGQLTLAPALNFNGVVTITITVTDTEGASDSEIFNLTINAVNDAPVTQDLYLLTSEDTPIEVPISGSDVEGSSLIFEVVDPPQHGGLGPSFVVSIDASDGAQTHSLDLGFLPCQ